MCCKMVMETEFTNTVMIQCFRTDWSWQTVQTQIKLLLEEQSDQGLHCLLVHLHIFDKTPSGLASLFEFSNSNISATSGPIVTKFYQKHHWGGRLIALGLGPGRIGTLVSMATNSSHRVIMGKMLCPLQRLHF